MVKQIVSWLKQSWVTILLCFLMWIMMLYMHFEVYIKEFCLYEDNGRFRPCYFALFDVLFILTICSLVSINRKRIALLLAFFTVLIVSLANIVYARIFDQYIIFDVISEISNFKGTWWTSYISQVTQSSDLILLCCILIAVPCICRYVGAKERISFLKTFIVFCLSFVAFVGSFLRKEDFSLFKLEDYKKMELVFDYNAAFHRELTCNQKPLVCRNGLVRTVLMDFILLGENTQALSTEDIRMIDDYLTHKNDSYSVASSPIVAGAPNLVLIIVESLLSNPLSFRAEDGKEVTPNINNLLRASGSYSNLHIQSNKGGGQSSDAQVSYFTGLLPIKNQHTILRLLKNECIALPSLLKEQKGYNTYISVPTMASFWHQIEANNKYGIDSIRAYGTRENKYWCEDEELFGKVIEDTETMNEPYFHAILTLSMHEPYYDDTIMSGIMYPKEYTPEYCAYLNKCHYSDVQIGHYLEYLRSKGALSNTVVIIASDHEPDVRQFNMPNGCFEEINLPFVISVPDSISYPFYQGKANQVDLFPTVLDLFGLKTAWRGFGHSLLDQSYAGISAEDYYISDKIINGDYFRRTSKFGQK